MIRVNLNTSLKTLGNENIGDQTLGKQLANSLITAQGEKERSMKFWDCASKLWDNEILQLDEVDFLKLKGFVENSNTMTVLVHAQLMGQLDKIKIPEK